MDLRTIGAASAGQSPARSLVRKLAYQVDPRSAEKWPKDDEIGSKLWEATQRLPFDGDIKRRAFSVGNWCCREFMPACIVLGKGVQRSNAKVGNAKAEILLALDKLDPIPEFNVDRFGDKESTLQEHHLDIIRMAIDEEVCLPNSMTIFDPSRGLCATIDDSLIALSPGGRLVPILNKVIVGEDIKSYNIVSVTSKCLLENPEYRESFKRLVDYCERQKPHYPNESSLNFLQRPNDVVGWIKLHFFMAVPDLYEQSLSDARREAIAISDTYASAESRLQRRILAIKSEDHVFTCRLILKDDSYLRGRLEGFNWKIKPAYSQALYYLRAACMSLEQDCFPAARFMKKIEHALLSTKMPNEIQAVFTLQGIEMMRLLGPYIDPSLQIRGNPKMYEHLLLDARDQQAWHKWFNQNLKGRTQQEDETKIRRFNDLVRAAATKVLDEHFVRDLDEVAPPGWRDMEVDFREWSDPLALS